MMNGVINLEVTFEIVSESLEIRYGVFTQSHSAVAHPRGLWSQGWSPIFSQGCYGSILVSYWTWGLLRASVPPHSGLHPDPQSLVWFWSMASVLSCGQAAGWTSELQFAHAHAHQILAAAGICFPRRADTFSMSVFTKTWYEAFKN